LVQSANGKIDNKVGAIHELANITNPVYDKWLNWKLSWARSRIGLDIGELIDVTSKNIADTRGCTHNIIIRTDLVKDWKLIQFCLPTKLGS
jgi:hypothetical protein